MPAFQLRLESPWLPYVIRRLRPSRQCSNSSNSTRSSRTLTPKQQTTHSHCRESSLLCLHLWELACLRDHLWTRLAPRLAPSHRTPLSAVLPLLIIWPTLPHLRRALSTLQFPSKWVPTSSDGMYNIAHCCSHVSWTQWRPASEKLDSCASTRWSSSRQQSYHA